MAEHHEDKHGGGDDHGGGNGAKHGGGHGKGHGPEAPHEEHHEGAPEWLISFADNTALMMGFFVILLAMNMAPKGSSAAAAQSDSQAAKESGQTTEQLDWAIGVREAFHNPVDPDSKNPRDRILAMRMRERAKHMGQADDKGVDGQHDKSQSLNQSERTGLVASVEFPAHASDINEQSRKTIFDMAQKLRGNLQIVEVRGHTSAAENSPDPAYVTRLSFDRALAVSNELVKAGMDRAQLRVVACGDAELVRRRAYTQAEHHVNERAEIIVTAEVTGNRPVVPGAR